MIHFFCALPGEAQPIIQYFKLAELKPFDLFRIYQSKDQQYSLTITGIGRINAASAVSYHHASLKTTSSDIWLNIGVAGHADSPVGTAFLINKITDCQDKTCWYPQILFNPNCASAPLFTLDAPSTDYRTALFDMEGAAFYQMAIRLGTAELIHSYKIISDNHEQPPSMNADEIKKLLAAKMTSIDTILTLLKPLATEIRSINTTPEHYQTFIKKWHFTHYERIQLARLLRQWSVRVDKDVMQFVADSKNSKSLIQSLQNKLARAEFQNHD